MSDDPVVLDRKAFKNGIKVAAHDPEMMRYLRENTGGKVGSGIEPLTNWNEGWQQAHREDFKKRFSQECL
jgi:hypothetical protein